MTLAHLTRSLLIAFAMLLLGAASVAADEPDTGLLGGAPAGTTDLVEEGTETAAELPPVRDIPVEPVADVVEKVVGPVAPPVQQIVAPVVERVVEPAPTVVKPVTRVAAPIVEAVTRPAAPVVQTTVRVAAPVAETVAPVVEPVARPVARATRPVARPVQRLTPVPKPVVEELVAPVVGALEPVADSVAPVVRPLVPVVDTATGVVRPVTDPIGRVLPPVVGPIGVGPILDPVIRPGASLAPRTPTGPAPTVGATTDRGSSPSAVTDSVPGTRSEGAARVRRTSAALPGRPAPGGLLTSTAHVSAWPRAASHSSTPLAAFTGEVVGSAPDGGFSIVILAAMALAVIGSRASLSASRFARPPSLSFAPAVPPA